MHAVGIIHQRKLKHKNNNNNRKLINHIDLTIAFTASSNNQGGKEELMKPGVLFD